MKTRKFDKKLVLSKETVADLTGNEMRAVYGGLATDYYVSKCVTDCLSCYPTNQSKCCP
jgi:hypothetical protein